MEKRYVGKTMTYEITKLDRNTRELISNSSNAFEALSHVDVGLVDFYHANRDKLTAREIMPAIVRFGELKSDERINLVRTMGAIRQAEIGADVSKYQVDGAVKITELTEGGQNYRVKVSEENSTERTRISENALTLRHNREMETQEKINSMQCHVMTRALEARLEGEKYVSDNKLREVYAETEMRRHVEEVRAITERGISRDRLEEKVRTAELAMEQTIRTYEIQRQQNKDSKKAEMVLGYVLAECRIIIEHIKTKGLEKIEREKTKQEFVKGGLGVIGRAIDKGKEDVYLELRDEDKRISLDYSSNRNRSLPQIPNSPKDKGENG
ncbi:hypothetical protein J4416_04840 [Candidatus Pacearchaeota archaeon]|nr:hypothetical protein [Candidatus Pacearchaeota archaeon]